VQTGDALRGPILRAFCEGWGRTRSTGSFFFAFPFRSEAEESAFPRITTKARVPHPSRFLRRVGTNTLHRQPLFCISIPQRSGGICFPAHHHQSTGAPSFALFAKGGNEHAPPAASFLHFHSAAQRRNLLFRKTRQIIAERATYSFGRLLAVHPPPRALMSNTLASIRLRMMSMSFRSLVSAVVCAVTTSRYVSMPPT